MLPDLPFEQVVAAVDKVVARLMSDAAIMAPPVDAVTVAAALSIEIAVDDRQPGRARFVRLAGRRGARDRASILVSPDPRSERRQWAVAHELGEWSAARIFARLGLSARDAPFGARETLANLFAARLLLPSDWFADAASAADFDLYHLKATFETASHELIARRELDLSDGAIVSVFDQGSLTWRRSNLAGLIPTPSLDELELWQAVHESGISDERASSSGRIRCWPVHEDGWRREILRTEVANEA